MNRIRVGILGAARIVPRGILRPSRAVEHVEIVAIASRSERVAATFAGQHSIPRWYAGYDSLLNDREVDAVYIALPTALHFEWAIKALTHGKHVLCEKPLAANADQAMEVAQEARRRGLILAEGMHTRYRQVIRRQRDIVRSGELGKLLEIESYYATPYIPMKKNDFRLEINLGGGAALDLGCYAISDLRFVSDAELEIVSCSHKLIRPGVDRWMKAHFRLSSGGNATVFCGFRGFYFHRTGVKVIGEYGSVCKSGRNGLSVRIRGRTRNEVFPKQSTFLLQLDAFAKAVAGKESELLSPDDSVATLRVIDAMYLKAGLLPRGTGLPSRPG